METPLPCLDKPQQPVKCLRGYDPSPHVVSSLVILPTLLSLRLTPTQNGPGDTHLLRMWDTPRLDGRNNMAVAGDWKGEEELLLSSGDEEREGGGGGGTSGTSGSVCVPK